MKKITMILAALAAAVTLSACSGAATKPEPAPVATPVAETGTAASTTTTTGASLTKAVPEEGVGVLKILKQTDCKSKTYERAQAASGGNKLTITLTDCETISLD